MRFSTTNKLQLSAPRQQAPLSNTIPKSRGFRRLTQHSSAQEGSQSNGSGATDLVPEAFIPDALTLWISSYSPTPLSHKPVSHKVLK